jgi:hypothetical protein
MFEKHAGGAYTTLSVRLKKDDERAFLLRTGALGYPNLSSFVHAVLRGEVYISKSLSSNIINQKDVSSQKAPDEAPPGRFELPTFCLGGSRSVHAELRGP